MELWIGLIGGIIIGWVLEWVIDWLYWRRGIESFYVTENELRAELSAARETITSLQTELETMRHAQLEKSAPELSGSAASADLRSRQQNQDHSGFTRTHRSARSGST